MLRLITYIIVWKIFSSVQFSHSVVSDSATAWMAACQASLSITNSQSSLKTHVYRVGDAIQPSHPLSSPFPPAPNPSQHQSLFQWGNSAWGGQSTGVSALASFLPTNTQILVTHKFLHFYSILTMIKYHRSVKTLSYDLSSMGYCFEKFSHLLVLLIVQELNYTQIFLPSSHHLLILLSI